MSEAKNALDLVEVDVLLDPDHVRVQVLDVLDIGKDKSLLWVEAEGDDVLDVAYAHCDCAFGTLEFKLGAVDVLLVVCDLDHNRHVECFLHPLAEDERDGVPKMESFSRRSTSGIKIKWFLGLVGLQDVIEVPVAEEYVASQEWVCLLTRELFDLLNVFVEQLEAAI